ncbi:MAG: hypothetical protein RR266_04150 [Bacilli bacterium]
MKEAISNSVILGIVITFMAILVALLATSSSYSKAFKVKNRVIEMIEQNQGYDDGLVSGTDFIDMIDTELAKYGYRQNTSIKNDCPIKEKTYFNKDNKAIRTGVLANQSSRYNYCVYKFQTDKGFYYGVLTYMYFDIPLVDNIKLSVYGETKTLFDLSNF